MSALTDGGELLKRAADRGIVLYLRWGGIGHERDFMAWRKGTDRESARPVTWWLEHWDEIFPVDITTDETARLAEILETRE